jgi:hypothetical protein
MMMRSKSIEWHTHVSDTVVIAKVTRVAGTPPDFQDFWGYKNVQQAKLQHVKSLRGGRPQDLSIPQYYNDEGRTWPFVDALLAPGDEVLAFYARDPVKRKSVLHFWINLTKPDVQLSSRGANTNESQWLSDGDAVLAAVTERIGREKISGRGRRGIISWFAPGMAQEIFWDLVRTAEPECKPEIIRELHEGDTEAAICNLISYPGRETEELIRPFLRDPRCEERKTRITSKTPPIVERYRRRKIYPYRQSAYIALKLLGKKVALPAGCDFAWMGFAFHGGFEDDDHFPHGNWKRIHYRSCWQCKKLVLV